MFLDETTVDQILKWLSIELAPICEADPNVLAKYVVALLRHDKGKELKSHCVEQLRDFLKDETEPFVDLLFVALEDGSYARAVSQEDDDEQDLRKQGDDNNDDDGDYRRWPRKRDGSDDEAPTHGDDTNNDDDYHRRYRADRHEDSDSYKKRRLHDTSDTSYRSGLDRRNSDDVVVPSLGDLNETDRNQSRGQQRIDRGDRGGRKRGGEAFSGGAAGRSWGNNGPGSGSGIYGPGGRKWDDRRAGNGSGIGGAGGGGGVSLVGSVGVGGGGGVGTIAQKPFQQQRYGTVGGRMGSASGPNGFGSMGMAVSGLGNGPAHAHSPAGNMMMYGAMPMSGMYNVGMGMGMPHGAMGPPGMQSGYRMGMGPSLGMGMSPGMGMGMGMASMMGALLPRTMGTMAMIDKRVAEAQSAGAGSASDLALEGGSTVRPPAPSSAPPIPAGAPPSDNAANSMAMAMTMAGSNYSNMIGLSEHTLRCTGCPAHVSEQELRSHFATFGRIVDLRVINSPPIPGASSKSYCECLVQFFDPVDAKKCYNSPLPVLNNRFIKLFFHRTNIVHPGSVPSTPSNEDNVAHSTSSLQPKDSFSTRQMHGMVSEDQKREQAHRGRAERAEAGQAVLHAYDSIRTLRQEAEALFKKREKILLDQIDQYKAMLSKLSSHTGSANSTKMLETVESKLVELQSQLQSLRDQHERGESVSDGHSHAASTGAGAGMADRDKSVAARGRGRGFGRGSRGGRGGRGLSWSGSPTGLGRGRGRGMGMVRLGNQSIDNRPKALLVQNPPSDFVHMAESHFSRFGTILKCEEVSNGIVVEFTTRKHAETAKVQGTSYAGQLLTLAWQEASLSKSNASGNDEFGPPDDGECEVKDEEADAQEMTT